MSAKISSAGCSYSIKTERLQKAVEIIDVSKEYGVQIKGFYKQVAEDKFEKIEY